MLFAVSGDSYRQLLLAWFLRRSRHPGSWALRHQEGGIQGLLGVLPSAGPWANPVSGVLRPSLQPLPPSFVLPGKHFPHFAS